MKSLITVILGMWMVALPLEGQAASRAGNLEEWFRKDLTPYVSGQLRTMPRFRNESFRFVVMVDDSPQSEGSALAIRLRDRLRDSVSDIPGIRVAWQADQPGTGLVSDGSGPDCTKNEANYFIGIELSESPGGLAEIKVRALDIEERAWVTGFNRSWRGTLTGTERIQLRQTVADATFRGERHAPWNDSEIDLMAASLAYELGCSLLRQTAGEYVLDTGPTDENIDAANALVELVGNNLASARALQYSAASGSSNAVIEGKAHLIDEDLYQYWVTITPTDEASGLSVLSADAYVRIPDKYAAATLVPDAGYELPKGDGGFLSTLRIVRLDGQRACLSGTRRYSGVSDTGGRYRFGAADCFALQLRATGDAIVFFLNHQLNHGLVRLADEQCAHRSLARIARTNEELRFPLPLDSLQTGSWSAADTWSLHPKEDSYYVVAATDTRAARALSRHIEQLPLRCSASLRSGLEGEALRRWLEELNAIANHWSAEVDWQSIRVKDVY